MAFQVHQKRRSEQFSDSSGSDSESDGSKSSLSEDDFLGDLFHMKPVISPTAEGAVKAGTVRDKDEQLKFALEKLEKGLGQNTRPLIMLEYSDNRQWVENNVLGEIKSRYASAEIILQPLSLTSGAHMGPGTWAVAFLPATH